MARLIGSEGRSGSDGAVRRDDTGRWVDARKSAPPRDGGPSEGRAKAGDAQIRPRRYRASFITALVLLIFPVMIATLALRNEHLVAKALSGDIRTIVYFGFVALACLVFLPFVVEPLFGLASFAYDHRGLTYKRWGRTTFRPWRNLSQAGVVMRRIGWRSRFFSIGLRDVTGSDPGLDAPPRDYASASIRIPATLFYLSGWHLLDIVADINSVRAQVLGERPGPDNAAAAPKG
ncbi:MAG TPA: hypothetical protein VFI76_00785 [Terrimicrobiaceae bacterium]|nr:hypothetical protein [Terrimicrobiaceae bacterium]